MADPVTVWLLSRESVAKSPCKCGSLPGIYNRAVGAILPPFLLLLVISIGYSPMTIKNIFYFYFT